ncbi:MAG TPA: hypothetical protein VLF62_04485, partial [Candidatus Saccharimonadales bacterium]|nr:hypothetical protein [Candidatus Saccharimonadales bacterium]
MAGGPENLPIGATPRIVTPTPEEFDQALAILHPADHASLLALGEKPDLPFLLVRPFIDPPQEVLEPLHDDIARILQVHGAEHTWTSAGVKKPAYMGATHFDGELAAIGKEDLYQRISGLALAVKMCAALPQTATQPQTATSEKASSSSPNKTRVLTWLGLACEAGVIEYNIVDGLANRLLYPKVQASAVRSLAYL